MYIHVHTYLSFCIIFIMKLFISGVDFVRQSKRDKPDSSNQPVGQVPLSFYPLQHIDRWRQLLADSYLAQECSTDAWPPVQISEFIYLNLVEQDRQAHHIGLQTIQKNIDAVYGHKIKIDSKELIQKVDSGFRLLIEGRPGSGKTTYMMKVSCDWSRSEILNSKLVIFVRLRHLPTTQYIYLHDLIKTASPAFLPDDIQGLSSYIDGRFGEDVVFILDGFDEYAPGASDENYISRLTMKQIYPRSIVILSSRPAATQRFRQKATLWVEVVGFMKEQVLQYINSYFENNKEKFTSLIKHLEQHQNLMNICYLPLHCAMLTYIYKVDGTLPNTETEFYRDFTLSLLSRVIYKQDKQKNLSDINLCDELPKEVKDVFHKVCKLAFKATVDSRQVFKDSEVHDIQISGSSGSDKESIGLLVIDRYFAKFGVNKTYSFLHLTLQEYLAAIFISKMSESEQIHTVSTYCNQISLTVTWCFLFGMLDYSKESAVNLFQQLLDVTGFGRSLLHVQCAYESQCCDVCTSVVHYHKERLLFKNIHNPLDPFRIAYVLKAAHFFSVDLSFVGCNFSVDNIVTVLKGVGDRQLSLRIEYVNSLLINFNAIFQMYIFHYRKGECAQSLLTALSSVTVPGLIELM